MMNEGAIALLLAAAMIAGVLVGLRIQARENARAGRIAPVRGRALWIPGSLLALGVAFAGVLVWIGVVLLGEWMDREHLLVRRPVAELRVTLDADDGADAWRVSPASASARVGVDRAPAGRRGADGALRVQVDLAGLADTAVVQVSGADLPAGFTLATAWVYVEDSDAAQSAGLHAHLTARMNAGSNGSFSLVGARTRLEPGVWTQVAWAGSYTLELSPALGGEPVDRRIRASERPTFLSVRLEADRPYRGAVFVDDLRMYAAGAVPPR